MNLTEGERQELESLQRKRTAAMAQVRRARLILMLDDGASRDTIKSELKFLVRLGVIARCTI